MRWANMQIGITTWAGLDVVPNRELRWRVSGSGHVLRARVCLD